MAGGLVVVGGGIGRCVKVKAVLRDLEKDRQN